MLIPAGGMKTGFRGLLIRIHYRLLTLQAGAEKPERSVGFLVPLAGLVRHYHRGEEQFYR